jgi:RNA polymerase sigma factor (TIGR02999 family)
MGSARRSATSGPGHGQAESADAFLPVAYNELRRLAAHHLARETGYPRLEPSALVHEAWLRLASGRARYLGHAHFLVAASETMRQILLAQARHRHAARHGGGQTRVALDGLDLAAAGVEGDWVAVDECLESFAHLDARKAALVRLRYFAGFTLPEAAGILGISPATAKRWWSISRNWLYDAISRTRQEAYRVGKPNPEQQPSRV